jgi:integrase
MGFEDPCDCKKIIRLANSIHVNWARSGRKKLYRKPFPITILINYCENLNSYDRLVRATIVSIGFRSMLRPSEIVNLLMDSIVIRENNLIIKLGVTKVDRVGDDNPIIVESTNSSKACAVNLFRRYIVYRNNLRINSNKLFILNGREITYRSLNQLIKDMCKGEGIQQGISAHSLRIGVQRGQHKRV